MKNELNYQNFIKAIRFDTNCLLSPIIEDIYETINDCTSNVSNMIDLTKIKDKQYIEKMCDKEDINEMEAKIIIKFSRKKWNVYYGYFNDILDNPTEAFFCMRSIKIDTDEIFFRILPQ